MIGEPIIGDAEDGEQLEGGNPTVSSGNNAAVRDSVGFVPNELQPTVIRWHQYTGWWRYT